MHERTLGVTALSVLTAMVGIYGLWAAVALLMGGTLTSFAGSDQGTMLLVLSAVFFAQAIAAFVVATGLWTRSSWAWSASAGVFVVLVVINVVLSVVASSYINLVLPLIGSIGGLIYLYRPSVREQFVGTNPALSRDTGRNAVGDTATV